MTIELICPACGIGDEAEAVQENGIVQLVNDDKGFCPACGQNMEIAE